MLLARMLDEYPVHVRADMQQYYGLNIERMGIDYSMRHAADLIAMLPSKSRTFRAIDARYEWDMNEYLLAEAVDSLHMMVWANSKDAQKNRNRPKPLPRPGSGSPSRETIGLDAEEYAVELMKPRKEVGYGNGYR
ncbi:DUF5361 domain-containing protein [Raoultibacter phocaeensis]|uniref:DUF5361 domain-containing protein n=1 Tax=Raoultibacter phocaeensis TaxID=2479841 RepID=UPI001118DF49|nr:DUF5361 domain-containing protein [Raoultibacter phocaeensis]